MQAIANGISWILAKFAALATWLGQLAVKVFESGWHLVTDLACWVLESALGLVVVALGAFDFSALTQYVNTWAQLPAGVIEVLSAVGLSQAVGIVVTAIGIRIMLQLIPFTRLGS